MDWSERGNIRKKGSSWEPFRKNSTLWSWQANQSRFKKEETSRHPIEAPEETEKSNCCPTEDWELEAPTAANRALGLTSIPGAAVTQKVRCHLVEQSRMPRAR